MTTSQTRVILRVFFRKNDDESDSSHTSYWGKMRMSLSLVLRVIGGKLRRVFLDEDEFMTSIYDGCDIQHL